MSEQASRNQLGFKIKTISKLIGQNMNNRITSLGLTSSQGFILGYLCRRQSEQETVYPKDIEKHFGFSHPTVSGLLQRLEAKGFIQCEPSPEDRRSKQITTTDKAQQLNADILEHIRMSELALTRGMTREEVLQLHSLLDRLIQNIDPSLEEGGKLP